jgi:hypothetical protein
VITILQFAKFDQIYKGHFGIITPSHFVIRYIKRSNETVPNVSAKLWIVSRKNSTSDLNCLKLFLLTKDIIYFDFYSAQELLLLITTCYITCPNS